MTRLAAALARELCRRAESDPRVWVIDGDLGDSYGLEAPVVAGLGRRFVQAGIAEQSMVSLAGGLAACGSRPWVFSFASFACCRAYDQIRTCVSFTNLPVTIVGSHAGASTGKNGKTHALLNDLALMTSLPNLSAWAPADVAEAEAVVSFVMDHPVPAYVRLPRDPQPALPPPARAPARARRWGSPGRCVLVSCGAATHWALETRARLRRTGVDVAVLHLLQVHPLPWDDIEETIGRAEHLVVFEDHSLAGGLADSLRRALPATLVSQLAWPAQWAGGAGDMDEMRRAHGLDDASLTSFCAAVVRERERSDRSSAGDGGVA